MFEFRFEETKKDHPEYKDAVFTPVLRNLTITGDDIHETQRLIECTVFYTESHVKHIMLTTSESDLHALSPEGTKMLTIKNIVVSTQTTRNNSFQSDMDYFLKHFQDILSAHV